MNKAFGIGLVSLFLILPVVSFAQAPNGGQYTPDPNGGQYTPLPNSGQYTPSSNSPASYTVKNPLGVSSVCGLVKGILQAALDIGIPIAVLFIVYAGFKFVLARGNATKLAEAKANMLWTLVGIAIFLGAWLLAQVIANTVNSLNAGSGQSIVSCK